MAPKKVAMLTAGGLAPCLSSCVASLIECYAEKLPDTEVYCYLNGFRALPISDKIRVTPEMVRQIHHLHSIGGSPIGNSRVSLDNPQDCYRRKLVPEGENPWHVACAAIVRDGIEVIHPIGGDGTSIGAARLAHYSHELHAGYKLAVIGLPKTIDNDIVPISQSLGAHTAASESAKFFRNVVGENTASDHFLLVHEIMGRNCGYLAAETTRMYREEEKGLSVMTGSDYKRDVHALYVPEMAIDFEREVVRLRAIMKKVGCVNVFVSEGACLDMIVAEMERSGEEVARDLSGNIVLAKINVGEWIAKNFGKRIGATNSLVQKSGYFSRAAPADAFDRDLIRRCCEVAVDEAIKGSIGIVGPNENKGGKIELIPLDQIKGGRLFDVDQKWFVEMMEDIGQCSKGHVIMRAISIPHPASIVKGPKEGLFVKKEEITQNLEFDNEINFAVAFYYHRKN